MKDQLPDDPLGEQLAELMDRAVEPHPYPAEKLRATVAEQGSDLPGRLAGRSRFLAVAAVVVVAMLAGVGLWSLANDSSDLDAVGETPQETPLPLRGFDGWEPGWHVIDPGSLPTIGALAWAGDRMIVSGTTQPDDGDPQPQAFAYDPQTREWTELPPPPFAIFRIVAADDQLVVVGYDDVWPATPQHRWATLDPDATGWRERGRVQGSPQLAATGVVGQGTAREQLVWTGQRIIDLGLGAVLDPVSGSATELAMPEDLLGYAHLLTSTPVWTGNRLVLTAWTERPGLAWNTTGSKWSEVPAPIETGSLRQSEMPSSSASGGADRVVLVAGRDDQPGLASMLNPETGEWTALPDIPGPAQPWCPYRVAVVAEDVIVQPCLSDYGTPLRLDGERWVEIEAAPFGKGCCMGTWLGTPGALLTWFSDGDKISDSRAPYREGAVWIPGSS